MFHIIFFGSQLKTRPSDFQRVFIGSHTFKDSARAGNSGFANFLQESVSGL
jgi:hypothetical protein